MKYHLFPKFFKHLSLPELMEHCAEAGIDGPVAMMRREYWIEEETLSTALPEYIRNAEKANLEVRFAFTDYSVAGLLEDDAPLRVIADNGIRDIRIAPMGRDSAGDVRKLHDYSRGLVERIAAVAEVIGVRVIMQLHGGIYPHDLTGGCHPHNATAAWHLVRGLNPAHIGIMIDPGNNIHQEGFEAFAYQIPLLGDYISAVGAKDACALRTGREDSPTKGWQTYFVPCYEGQANWHEIYRQLKQAGFDGPMILMPFYDEDNFTWLFGKFTSEVEYLKGIGSSAGE